MLYTLLKTLQLKRRLAAGIHVVGSLVFCVATVGCGGPAELEDITDKSAQGELVGAKFEVEGSTVLHGIIDLTQGDQHIDWYSVFPSPGIGGTEVASSIPLPKGTIFTVQRVLRRKSLFGGPTLLQVSFDDFPLLPNAPVYIGLYGGNEGKGSVLSEAQFRRAN